MRYTISSIFCSCLLINACSSSDSGTPANLPDSIPLDAAQYELSFSGTWSAGTHPTKFPANAHFSALVGAVHNAQIIFWEPGQLATAGIEVMAESGSPKTLGNEISTAQDAGTVFSGINGPGIDASPGNAVINFFITPEYPEVSVVTMLAPSPDWFTGVHNLSLLDDDGTFVDQKTVDLHVYDSGTDSGTSFASGDNDTQPPEPISLVTSEAADSSLVDGEPIIGTFTFKRVDIKP